jgi:hypothetical protein
MERLPVLLELLEKVDGSLRIHEEVYEVNLNRFGGKGIL